MANNIVGTTNAQTFEDRAGNHYIILDVYHQNGDDTFVIVPDSAVSVAELPGTHAAPTLTAIAGSATGTISPSANEMGVQNLTSGASGLGFDFVANDGVKQVHIDTSSTTGTYKLVVRCIGSAAGTGSTNAADL